MAFLFAFFLKPSWNPFIFPACVERLRITWKKGVKLSFIVNVSCSASEGCPLLPRISRDWLSGSASALPLDGAPGRDSLL